MTGAFRGFPLSLEANSEIVGLPEIRPHSFQLIDHPTI
jgi:hypothetical protein